MTDERWSIEECYRFDRTHATLKMVGVPLDYNGFRNTRDLVPYSQKALDRMTAKLLHLSPEFRSPHVSVLVKAQDTRQRLPTSHPGGASMYNTASLFTRQSQPKPFESGDNTLPGMEEFK